MTSQTSRVPGLVLVLGCIVLMATFFVSPTFAIGNSVDRMKGLLSNLPVNESRQLHERLRTCVMTSTAEYPPVMLNAALKFLDGLEDVCHPINGYNDKHEIAQVAACYDEVRQIVNKITACVKELYAKKKQ